MDHTDEYGAFTPSAGKKAGGTVTPECSWDSQRKGFVIYIPGAAAKDALRDTKGKDGEPGQSKLLVLTTATVEFPNGAKTTIRGNLFLK